MSEGNRADYETPNRKPPQEGSGTAPPRRPVPTLAEAERLGLGVTVWTYPKSSPEALEAVKKAAAEQSDRAAILVPVEPEDGPHYTRYADGEVAEVRVLIDGVCYATYDAAGALLGVRTLGGGSGIADDSRGRQRRAVAVREDRRREIRPVADGG